MDSRYSEGLKFCVVSAVPIAIGMAVIVSVEKGFGEFLSAILFWLLWAVLLNVAIGGIFGTLWAFIVTRFHKGSYVSAGIAGSIVGVSTCYVVLGNIGLWVALISVAWGLIAALGYWYGWSTASSESL